MEWKILRKALAIEPKGRATVVELAEQPATSRPLRQKLERIGAAILAVMMVAAAIINVPRPVVIEDVKLLCTLEGHTDWVRSVAFSPDGKVLASGSDDRTVRLWRLADILPDKPYQACPDTGYTLPGTGRQYLHTLTGHSGHVWSVAFSPDGSLLASGSGWPDYAVRLWRVFDASEGISGQHLHTLTGHTAWVNSVAFSPEGSPLASGADDGTVQLWRVSYTLPGTGRQAAGQHLRTFEVHTEGVNSIAFSPDGSLLASGTDDGTVQLWRVSYTLTGTGGQHPRMLTGHGGAVLGVAFSPDGKVLASGSDDRTVRLWRVADGQNLRTLAGHTGWVRGVAFSPDGSLLASGSYDDTVRLWRVADGQHLFTLTGHTDSVCGVAFSPAPPGGGTGGALLASGSRDGTVRLWGLDLANLQYQQRREPSRLALSTNAPAKQSGALAPGDPFLILESEVLGLRNDGGQQL